MPRIHIVLHEPEIPQNTGNIARTCAATGASLHLIRPLGFSVDDRKMRRAGLDYWDKLDVHFYDGLEDFLAGHPGAPLYCFTTKAQHGYTDVTYPDEVFLLFGKETRGLPEEFLLSRPESCVRIPMLNRLRSLNLSNSVAIAVYEVLRQHGFEGLQEVGALHDHVWVSYERNRNRLRGNERRSRQLCHSIPAAKCRIQCLWRNHATVPSGAKRHRAGRAPALRLRPRHKRCPCRV